MTPKAGNNRVNNSANNSANNNSANIMAAYSASAKSCAGWQLVVEAH